MRIRKHLTYANVAATMALVLAMSGSAYALVVTSNQIKNGTIKSIDVGNGKLTGADVKNGSLGLGEVGFTSDMAGQTRDTAFSSETGGATIASGQVRLKKPGSALAILTLDPDGGAFGGTLINLQKVVDGTAIGPNIYIVPADDGVKTISLFIPQLSKGLHTIAVRTINNNDNVTFEGVEFGVIALP